MKKIKIVPKNSTADVNQIYSREQRVEIDKAQAPFELTIEKLVLTPVVRLSKQTGTHQILANVDNFKGSGSFEDLVGALSSIGVDLTFDGEQMVLTNRSSRVIELDIQALGRSGKEYKRIPQENTSIDLMGKNTRFSLAPTISNIDLEQTDFRIRLKSFYGYELSKSEQFLTINPERDAVGENSGKVINLSNLFDSLELDEHGCTKWSRPIQFSDINHVMTNGGLTVVLNDKGVPNFWIDQANIHSVEDFFNALRPLFNQYAGLLETTLDLTDSSDEPIIIEPPMSFR